MVNNNSLMIDKNLLDKILHKIWLVQNQCMLGSVEYMAFLEFMVALNI